MNVIGEMARIVASRDPTKIGLSGLIVMETANTLMIESAKRTLRIEKLGTTFRLLEDGRTVNGADIAGRLQDRLGRKLR